MQETVVEIVEDETVPTNAAPDKAVPKDKRQTTPFMTKVSRSVPVAKEIAAIFTQPPRATRVSTSAHVCSARALFRSA